MPVSLFPSCGISIQKERGTNTLYYIFSSGELDEVHYDLPRVGLCLKFGVFSTLSFATSANKFLLHVPVP